MRVTRSTARRTAPIPTTPGPDVLRISLVFFVSGAASLVFEVSWFHRAGLVFGNGVWAASVVLSSFMGGLALGNALVGWYGAGARRPLRTYAVLEIIVAVSGIALTYALPSAGLLVLPISRLHSTQLWFVNGVRLIASFAALLVPATAMGATLPILAGGLSTGRAGFGRVLGHLYGWNTLGAVLGVIAAEVLLVDRLGVTGSAWLAALLDLAAAGGAWLLSRREADAIAAPLSPRAPGGASWRLLACAFLAGGALLALEIVWFRFLSMYVLTTTLAVSLMLAAVLAAIGLGGLAASRWLALERLTRPRMSTIALMSGCSTALSYLAFQWLTRGTQIGEWHRVLWLACALTAPTSFLSGMLFTLIGDGLAREIEPTRAAAWLALANTIGAMCGPPLAAFVLLPIFGMERTLFIASAVYALIGVLLIPGIAPFRAAARSPVFALSAIVLAAALIRFPFGLMADRYFARAAAPYTVDGSEIVATREGPSDTIFLMQQKWLGQPVYSRLVTNGFSMTGTNALGLRYMRYFAYWPMLLHQGPVRRALVVCYGLGVTAGAVLDLPGLETVDIVELSHEVVSTSDIVYPSSGHPLHDPRVRLHIDDGRYFLQASDERFDLITGEPPPPRTPGAVNIYTREYFGLIRDRLAEGGIATYWVPVGRPDPGTDVHTIIRAFCDVFDDCSLWNATPFDLMLVGTRHAAGPVSEAAFSAAWRMPALAGRLREVGFEEPQQIGATFIGDSTYLRALTGRTPSLTDDFPQRLRPVLARPSLSDPRYGIDRAVTELYHGVLDPSRAQAAFLASDFVRRLWPRPLIDQTRPLFGAQRIINQVLWEGGRPLRRIEDLHALLTTTTLHTLPLWQLGSDEVTQRIAEASVERSGATEYARGLRALAARDYLRAAAHLGESERRGLRGATVRPLQVYALCLAGDLDTARQLARGAEARDADEQHFWTWMRATFGVVT